MLGGKWADYVWPNSSAATHYPETGVKRDELIKVAKASVTLPESFVRHPFGLGNAITLISEVERPLAVEETHQ